MTYKASLVGRAAPYLAVAAGVALAASAAVAAAKVNVLGTVADSSGDPVAGARVELLDAKKNVVAEAKTDELGGYRLPCVDEGAYVMRLDCPKGCRPEETVETPVGPRGLTVRWTLGDGKAPLAVASATGGPCSAAAAAAAAAGGAAGTGAGATTGAGAAGAAGGAGVAAGAGAIVVGGTLGGLAASGSFDGGSPQTTSK